MVQASCSASSRAKRDLREKKGREGKVATRLACLQFLRSRAALASIGLAGQELRVDVGQDTTLGNDDVAEQAVQLFVAAHVNTEGQHRHRL